MLPILLTSSNISTSATSLSTSDELVDAMEWSVALDIVASCKSNTGQNHKSHWRFMAEHEMTPLSTPILFFHSHLAPSAPSP